MLDCHLLSVCGYIGQAVGLALACALIEQIAEDGNTSSHELVEGWEGWVKNFAAPYGFGGEETNNPKMGTAGFLHPSRTFNPKLSLKPLRGVVIGGKPARAGEGQVSRSALAAVPKKRNLARSCGKERDTACDTVQTSTSGTPQWTANLAVDGKEDTASNAASPQCTKTSPQLNPWWRVDFSRQVTVTGLRVYGRRGTSDEVSRSLESRLNGFEVRVGNEDYPAPNAACAVNQPAPIGPDYYVDIQCIAPLKGQYLYIDLSGNSKILSLCEVQVWGEELPASKGGYDAWAQGASNEQKWLSGFGAAT